MSLQNCLKGSTAYNTYQFSVIFTVNPGKLKLEHPQLKLNIHSFQRKKRFDKK